MTPSAPSESDKLAPGHVPRSIERWRDGRIERLDDRVAEEMPVAMFYNGVSFAVMMATPHDLEDFALGFSLSEGLIGDASDLLAIEQRHLLEGIELTMTVAESAPATQLDSQRERLLPGRGGCGICGTRLLEDAVQQPRLVETGGHISRVALERALAGLHAHQPMNAATGAVHAAAWSDADGTIVLVREDVGRHNALDKLIGAMHHANIAPETGMLLLTSRASYEMVTKAASAGISIMAAISAPTALAIELARTAGMTLVGFARPGSHNVYTHPGRLRSDDGPGV
ncbi:formate dehydrogenase accessory sulfurtransferase FdhD [Rhodanobacter sp. C03]|uniref:formate dehydrogenase accessory sulfurtransferase FdhD n=1 Tax=Rhodanobacter sp. C03 TaxID=1945858 RepID=UPI000984B13F|nr:formate dehydrogenase accessory sulfurtransferase FdhD [Rhodanobacter sp. C03]OOG56534.1 sufurtransferase FdhD [Rhodanobacter sp. C03]